MVKKNQENSRKKIGLALGGGGARGLAHIGVIKVFEAAGVPIDFIAGTSMGALVGGWYALTKDILFLENLFSKIKHRDIFSKRKVMKGGNLFRDESVAELLEIGTGDKKIEDCQIPFAAVATDAHNGEMVVLSKGSLENAIKASASIPIFFRPVKYGNRMLTDGGLCNPVPVDIVKKMGADFVIAVDISSKWVDITEEKINVLKITKLISHIAAIGEYQIAKPILKQADIVLRPTVLSYDWHDFDKTKEIITEGKNEAERNLNQIAQMAGIKIKEKEKTPLQKIYDILAGS